MFQTLIKRYPEHWRSKQQHMALFLNSDDFSSHETSCFFEWSSMMRKTAQKPPLAALNAPKARPLCIEMHIRICNGLSKKSRILFLTRKTYSLGLCKGSQGSQVGDVLVFVSGVSNPLLLRENIQGGTYILVGFATFVMPPGVPDIDPPPNLTDRWSDRHVGLSCCQALCA
ncbi:hypothetical protein QQS21_011144 [Conoideocrella luteorostrata]|uniref:Uncharacterized protein n=1 Tax=Conoideocrella luteorostrata TaxID=1105319 RepID=A0AAJ0CFY8_9HYPO|nr:hypothetical protein QQS21_011144 [Conoideocrella luteorostrata]